MSLTPSSLFPASFIVPTRTGFCRRLVGWLAPFLAALGLAASVAPSSAQPLFASGFTSYDAANRPDFNLDGNPDLALANRNSNDVSVLLGNGDGSFGASTAYATGLNAHAVAIGDLDADGNPDLAVANHYSCTVSVLLGKGDGTFGLKQDYGIGSGPNSVAIGDFDGDDRPDLAVANFRGGSVAVLRNIGSGSPTSVTPLPAGALGLQLSVSPNPTMSSADVRFVMPSAGRASVEIFDVVGRQVAQLGPVLYEAGAHAVTWDGTSKAGTMAPAGVYLIRLTTNHGQATAQLVKSGR